MRRFTTVLALALAIALTGCGDSKSKGGGGGSGGTGGTGGTGGQVGEIEFVNVAVDPDVICSDDCLQIDVDQTLRLVATAFDAKGQPVEGVTFTWSSEDPEIAAVDADGVVTGVADGSVSIVAAAEGREGSLMVQVGAQKVMSFLVVAEGVDGTAAVAPGKWVPLSVVAFGGGFGLMPVRDAVIEWEASSDAVEVVEGVRTEEGWLNLEVRASVPGNHVVTFTSPAAAEGVEGQIAFEVVDDTILAGAFPFDSLAVGNETACGIAGGVLSCWGPNFVGQLGVGEESMPQPHPVTVTGDAVWTAVAAGQLSTCALDADGHASCWGDNGGGQLGIGDAEVFMASSPAPVAGDHVFASIAAGSNHSCALDRDGAAWCWGSNSDHQLGMGDGGPLQARSPALVAGGHVFTAIRPSGNFTCALDHAGKAWCWGSAFAAIGSDPGDGSPVTQPKAVEGDHVFTALDVGFSHACALDLDGIAWCWGMNEGGRLGTSSDDTFLMAPARVEGGHDFQAIATGNHHTCAIDVAGAVWCWGENRNGVLGDGSLVSASAPTRVVGDLAFRSIVAGGSTTCAITEGGDGYCWGSASAGQLGCGLEGTMRPFPTPITHGTCDWCTK